MEVKQVAALPDGLEVTGSSMIDDVLTITAVSTCPHSRCPLCSTPSMRVHSRYTRQVADLPCSGQQVRLLVHVRTYFCEKSDCVRKIFVERLTPFIEPWARVTQRLFQIVQVVGLATGGRLGVRVTGRFGIKTSRHTILRRIMALPTDPVGQVIELGIDDFSDHSWPHLRHASGRSAQSSGPRCPRLSEKPKPQQPGCASHPEIRVVSRDPGRRLRCCGPDSGSPGDAVCRQVPFDDQPTYIS
jgi:hypothetical protein